MICFMKKKPKQNPKLNQSTKQNPFKMQIFLLLSIYIHLAFSKYRSYKASIPGMLALCDLCFENAKYICILKMSCWCMTMLCLNFHCRQYLYWGVLSAPQNTEFWIYFIVLNIIWCSWNGWDLKPLKNSPCMTVLLHGRMILMHTKPRTSFSIQRSTRLLDFGQVLLRMKKPFWWR